MRGSSDRSKRMSPSPAHQATSQGADTHAVDPDKRLSPCRCWIWPLTQLQAVDPAQLLHKRYTHGSRLLTLCGCRPVDRARGPKWLFGQRLHREQRCYRWLAARRAPGGARERFHARVQWAIDDLLARHLLIRIE
jgi:hypothetical protein